MSRRPPLANRTNNKNANNNVRFETPAFQPGDFVDIDSQRNPAWICGHSHTPGGSTTEYSARYAIDNCVTPRVSLSRLETASFEPLSRQASSQQGVVLGPSRPSLLSRAHNREQSRSQQSEKLTAGPKPTIVQELLSKTDKWKRDSSSKGLHPMEKFLAKNFEKEEGYLRAQQATKST
jgi:hypothetical protein